MVEQRVDDRLRVREVLVHAHVQRAHAAQREIAVERRAGDAEAVGPPRELVAERGVARDDRAADDVAVAVQILRRRVHDDVRAERDRLLQRRREERVVDDEQRAGVVRRRPRCAECR